MITTKKYRQLSNYLKEQIPIAPLVVFRIAFGVVMLFSTCRYMWMGWVNTQLVDPKLHFSYYGFEWIAPLPEVGMYFIFILMIVSCIAIILGWFYRVFSALFFLCFSYVELIDITYYLNHYYFVSIISFLLMLVPAHRYFSLDVLRNPALKTEKVSRWCIGIFKLQIAIVYCYAGLAKINTDWLLHALPLSIWLPAKTSIPFIGFIFEYKITAYIFSWAGMLFDTFIIFGLYFRRTRWISYIAVVIFHTLTGILFQIGVFPLVMILAVTIFFSSRFHQRIIHWLAGILPLRNAKDTTDYVQLNKQQHTRWIMPFLIIFIIFQLVFPWRYMLYPGNIFWTEEGYRFSWRVMLMEKAGTATFYVRDGINGREGAVINRHYLNSHQEKQMAMQPDLILQFAHYLEEYFMEEGMNDPQVRAEVWVTLNAKPAQLLIDPEIDLTQLTDTWSHKSWIMPFEGERQP